MAEMFDRLWGTKCQSLLSEEGYFVPESLSNYSPSPSYISWTILVTTALQPYQRKESDP